MTHGNLLIYLRNGGQAMETKKANKEGKELILIVAIVGGISYAIGRRDGYYECLVKIQDGLLCALTKDRSAK